MSIIKHRGVDYDERNATSLLSNKVVISWSGGLDSTLLIPFLIEKYKTTLYPVFLIREQHNLEQEKKSVEHYSSVFQERYGAYFNEPFIITVPIPAKELRQFPQQFSHKLRNSDIIKSVVRYALYKNISVISIGSLRSDEAWGDSSVNYWALKTYEVREGVSSNDFWVLAPFQEENLDKIGIVNWHQTSLRWLDLSKTWSCYKAGMKHCGECEACEIRKNAFTFAKASDPTEYDQVSSEDMRDP